MQEVLQEINTLSSYTILFLDYVKRKHQVEREGKTVKKNEEKSLQSASFTRCFQKQII
jgi:hypothetical protein